MKDLLDEISECTICSDYLPLGPNPVLSASRESKVAIIGQAPGTKVHASGIPWDDQSGKTLRSWMEVSLEEFYDPDRFAIVPMGFCYPGKGKSGDLPPRPECAPLWHKELFNRMVNIDLVLLIGQYAQKYYLRETMEKNLTETVRSFERYGPLYIPLPHPSPRNRLWFKKNPWFESLVIPYLRKAVRETGLS